MDWNIWIKTFTIKVHIKFILHWFWIPVGVQWIGLGQGTGALSHQMELDRDRPDPLVSEALISIFFVYSALYNKLHTLSRQDQGEPEQILAKQVKKFIL